MKGKYDFPLLRQNLYLKYQPGPYQCLKIFHLTFHSCFHRSFWYYEDLVCSPQMTALTKIRAKAALQKISGFHVCSFSKEALQLRTVNVFSSFVPYFEKTSQSIPLFWGFLEVAALTSEVENSFPIVRCKIHWCWWRLFSCFHTIFTCQHFSTWFRTMLTNALVTYCIVACQ